MRIPTHIALALALVVTSSGAQAQNFFERLFGITPERTRPQAPYQNAPPPDTLPPNGEERRPSAPPVMARPVSMRVPTEDGVLGRDLKQNGVNGSLRVERLSGSDLRAKITAIGRRSAQSVETCTVQIGGPQGAVLVSQGRPDGVQRYDLKDEACPLQVDILDEAVLIKGKGEACLFQVANCQVDAAGMWGPDAAQLVPKARDYEAARAAADKSVRENYKALVQRSRPESIRPVVAEQAAFSSDREVLCRSYSREGSHSFCNARFSESRLLSLAQRLGVTYASNQAPAAGNQAADPQQPRQRRRTDPYGVPQTNDLTTGPIATD